MSLLSIIGFIFVIAVDAVDKQKQKDLFSINFESFNITGVLNDAVEAIDGIQSLYHLFLSPDKVVRDKLSTTSRKAISEDSTIDTQSRKGKMRSDKINKQPRRYQQISSETTNTELITSTLQQYRRMLSDAASPTAVNCSGVGRRITRKRSSSQGNPSSPILFSCNNVRVSRLTHDAIIASKDATSGVPVIKAATLAAGLSSEGPNVTRNGILLGSEPIPSVIILEDRLSPQQQAIVVRDANVEDIYEVVTMGQLFSDLLLEDTLNLASILASLSPTENAALLVNTTCTTSSAPLPPSQSGEETICVCPHDYFGPNCEFGMAIACGVVISDPLYNVCVGVNGVGFEIPKEIPTGTVATAAISSRIKNAQLWLQTVVPNLMGLTESTTSPASFTEARLPPLQGSDGFDDILAGTAVKGYRSLVPGHPPCLFTNRAQAKNFYSSSSPSSSSSSSSSSPSSSIFDDSAFINVRVSCIWQRENVTTLMSSGRTLVDEYGDDYAVKLPIVNTSRTRAREVVESALREAANSAPMIPQVIPVQVDDKNRNPPGVMRCNGSALTLAYIDARVVNRTASALRGHGPPFFGLNCIEQQFTYSVGGVWVPPSDGLTEPIDRDTPFIPPFSISTSKFRGGAATEGGLAVRFRPFSPTFVTDTSLTTLNRIPVDALDGSKDVRVRLLSSHGPQGEWAKNDAFWAGGRLFAEASVVHTSVGIAPDEVTSLIRDGALVTNLTLALAQDIRKTLVPSRIFYYGAIPRLVLTNILPIMIDDSSYVEPVGETQLTRTIRLSLSIGLPILILVGLPILWWQRRKRILDEIDQPESKED